MNNTVAFVGERVNSFFYKLKFLALCIYVKASFVNAEELNFSFLRNVKVAPSVLKSDTDFPAGTYQVDVYVNEEKKSRVSLSISKEEENNKSLCFSNEWLKNAGVLYDSKLFEEVYDTSRRCYKLGSKPHVSVNFNHANQSLDFLIPQAYMLSKTDASLWDYGVDGARLVYYSNFIKRSHSDIDAFGNFDLGINFDRWVLSSNLNVSHNSDKSEITSSDITLFTAISQVQGDFLIGKSQTRSELIRDFTFYGVSLISNNSMRPWNERGYAPTINGIATTTSRITVKQNGYVIYSRIVPAGPYILNDLRPTGNGDLTVSIEDKNGVVKETIYPVSTLPTLLRPDDYQYNFAIGKKNDSDKVEKGLSSNSGVFGLASFDYGFEPATLNVMSLLHNQYYNIGGGFTSSLGSLGAVSASGNISKAKFNDGSDKEGSAFTFKYAKNFTEKTDLQLLTYRYKSEGYVEFSDYNPSLINDLSSIKTRYEARLSHRFNDSFLSLMFWRQGYWNREGAETGASIGGSTRVYGDTSLLFNASYSDSPYLSKPDYSLSASLSIPLTIGKRKAYSNYNIGKSTNGGTTINAGITDTVNDRFNYNLTSSVDSKGREGISATGNYAFDKIQTNLSLSHTRNKRQDTTESTLSGSVSGSVIATSKTGVLLSKESGSTVGIISTQGVKGVKFNSSMPTNDKGNTVIWLSEYNENNIVANIDELPNNIELSTTSVSVIPTEKAIIYREFKPEKFIKYIVRVRDTHGNIISGGEARTEQFLNAGYVLNNGVLLMNLLAEPKRITIRYENDKTCHFDAASLEPNNNNVKDVICE
ncbi:PefC/AfrB family outer membrane usher protein [Escherichia coli]|nr:PefC/AfrB family outer membrane usher protein [Escherichia coli]MBM2920271.1 PefC/AfrB family outer membrane usher protein [Escherichia coli]MBM2951608.1 PefC/AfrB family outer membrane usher protein [Escherichia coli]HDN1277600.1 PefC/AfrB family outer membrane usher protein [Escherichia coli]